MKRIFLSFVNDQFKDLAHRLHQLLREAEFDVNYQPLMGQVADDTLIKLYDDIARCDLVVHLVGDKPGTTANSRCVLDYFKKHLVEEFLASESLQPSRALLSDFSKITYTQWEAWIALQLVKGLLVYAPKEDFDQNTKIRSDFPQAAHLTALGKAGRYAYPFQDVGEILSGVYKHFGIPQPKPRKIAASRILRHSPKQLFGRETELAALDEVWESRTNINVYSLIAWGGAGETSLVAHWMKALKDLVSLDLISVSPVDPELLPEDDASKVFQLPLAALQIDAHPLVREYFSEQLRTKSPEAFREAHSRLFDYLCESTEHRPDTLVGLQPLYQAVTHGCLAGRQQEACDKVYFDRIQRRAEAFSTKKLGAIGADLGAVAAFFEQPWSRLSSNLSEPDQAWLLNEAASSLRALGRLTEAVDPMRVGLESFLATDKWKSAAGLSSNLSELELTLGKLEDAVADGRRAVQYADLSEDAFQKMARRTAVADALCQRGEPDSPDHREVRELFAEAELAEARRLIEKHNYNRRLPELRHAEAAIETL